MILKKFVLFYFSALQFPFDSFLWLYFFPEIFIFFLQFLSKYVTAVNSNIWIFLVLAYFIVFSHSSVICLALGISSDFPWYPGCLDIMRLFLFTRRHFLRYSLIAGWVYMLSFSLQSPPDSHWFTLLHCRWAGWGFRPFCPADTFPAKVGHQLVVSLYFLVQV